MENQIELNRIDEENLELIRKFETIELSVGDLETVAGGCIVTYFG